VPVDTGDPAVDAVTTEWPDALRLAVSETYICPYCESEVDRNYRVQYVIRSCPECGGHGRFVHTVVAAALDEIPDEDRPEGWEEKPLDERLIAAVKAGLLDVTDTRVPDST
jgi:hypothetical protein